jgi:2,3-bisphosphoglycerate-dependent phosphoglycerate mutase
MERSPTKPGHATLVLLRHGESVWNRSQRLTGWADVPLTARGRAQARRAGARMRERGLAFDACFSSLLARATETRDLALAALGAELPVRASWRLNERHYGALQGLLPWQAVWRFGVRSVWRCRRDFDARPPLLEDPSDPRRDPGLAAERGDEVSAATRGESLGDVWRRLRPLWEGEIAPELRAGHAVLIVAHNNVLRALLHHLERPAAAGAVRVRLRTAQPLMLTLDPALRPLRREAL